MMHRYLLAGLLALLHANALPTMAQERVPTERIDQVLRQEAPLVLDVRTPEEIAEFGSLPGALHIPEKEVSARLSEIPPDRLILVA